MSNGQNGANNPGMVPVGTFTSGNLIVSNGGISVKDGGAVPSSGSPGGSTSDVQYNNAGSFAGDSDFTYDGAGHVSATSFNGFLTTGNISQWTNDSGYLTDADAVTSFSAGTTGLLPSSPSIGSITLSGTLNISNGGTGNTSYTLNSIPYFDGTKFTEDNANLAWVDGTKILNLGAGISIPANAFTVTQGAAVSGAGLAFTQTTSNAASSSSGTGNAGGTYTLMGGTGGNQTGSVGVIGAGGGGAINFTGGTGGNYTGAGTLFGNGGFGGTITIAGGIGGTTVRANGISGGGGTISLNPGNGAAAGVQTQSGGAGGTVSFQAGAGGAGGGRAGSGGSATLGSGNGGNSTAATTVANIGGGAGFVNFQSGVGGNAANSSVSNTAGVGGDITFSAGRAGTATGTGAAGARGGNFTIQGGAATSSTGITADGGIIYVIGGSSGPAGGQTGYIALNTNSAAARGGTIIGASTAPTAQLDIRPITAATIGEVVKGFTSQSADLTQWQNSSAGILGSVSSSGILTLGLAAAQTGTIKLNGTTSGTVTINPAAAAGTWTMTLPTTAGSSGQTLTTDGSGITSWSNILPTVTTVSLTGQTSDIGSTNFTGANIAGLYRVHYSLEDTASDITAGAVTLSIAYTADAGAISIPSAAQVLTGTGLTQGTIFVQLASGNISYSVSHTGLFGSAQYAVYMSVERLR